MWKCLSGFVMLTAMIKSSITRLEKMLIESKMSVCLTNIIQRCNMIQHVLKAPLRYNQWTFVELRSVSLPSSWSCFKLLAHSLFVAWRSGARKAETGGDGKTRAGKKEAGVSRAQWPWKGIVRPALLLRFIVFLSTLLCCQVLKRRAELTTEAELLWLVNGSRVTVGGRLAAAAA